MEHKLNKVDVEIIQKVIDITKEGRVHGTQKSEESTINYSNKKFTNKKYSNQKKQSLNSKRIVVDAYKNKNEITINATKYDNNVGGKYIDKKR
ncbi:hypothetical protein [Oceanirhabdus seepicola]|uniref:Uncharacterized protein n=1 Tax=Oceanirhabdus seepicola TaxID=2828781 RepID=A0A9J6NWW7_9CLOT|nr:hypothetical protein [Oceanirhabdus seepicola]MCM1988109.1 hypothetical protein [Oceanirhabdus seepicola]